MRILIASIVIAFGSPSFGLESSQGTIKVSEIASGFDQPWAVDVLPSGAIIVTERDGRLLMIGKNGAQRPVTGVPSVVDKGQGGLLDVMVPRDFTETSEIFLSAVIPQQGGSGTALIKATLNEETNSLEDVRVIFQQARGFSSAKHFGSRIVEGEDGTVFLTIGDRGDRPSAQDRRNHNGSVVRVKRSGAIPPDNPFVGLPGVEPEIYSYGHRNPQGAALAADGTLWINEHGARGGDEVNKISAGANYGWPIISYGRHYSGFKIGQGTEAAGMEQPEHYWDPSIAPSGMMIYSGALWPEWKGDIFVGSLKFDYIARLDGETLQEEQLQSEKTGRVRDIIEGPDGAIWFLSIHEGALFKLTP